MNYLVYKHTSPSGKAYIGITNDYDKRARNHRSHRSGCRAFAAAIRRYGWDNFLHEILYDNLTETQARYREQQLINEHGTMSPNGYNLTAGGEMFIPCTETKRRMSDSRRGRTLSLERRQKISNTLRGRTQTDERRLKNSKRYMVTTPTGVELEVTNLHQYCKDNNLNSSCMNKVAGGSLKQYKGWLVRPLF